jgi:hypothetical protein
MPRAAPRWASTKSRPSWPGVPCGISSLRLARLELNAPTLQLRRDAQGRFFAAGLEITPQPGDEDGFADWLLVQDRVVIRDASIAWTDELRGAPPLELKRLNFQLDNSGNRHRFGLTAEPPRELAARIDIRGDFKGRDIDQFDAWKGEAYAELDYADLAVWRTWVDYPVALPQGKGACACGWASPASSLPPPPPTCAWPTCACNCAPTCPNWTWCCSKAASPGVASTMASKPNSSA